MRLSLFVAAVVFVLAPLQGRAASEERNDRTARDAAYLLALGRAPLPDEPAGSGRLAGQFRRLTEKLRTDRRLQETVAAQAFQDAFGRSLAAGDALAAGEGSYVEQIRRHVAALAAQPTEYEQVIRRAYPLVIHREVYPEEITYWKKHGTVPFALLVAAIEDWARRNQPGLMVTAGTPTVSVNSEFLTTVRLSPAVAAEARTAAGLPETAGTERAPHHLIAAGGEALATGGGIYFVAAGRPDLVK